MESPKKSSDIPPKDFNRAFRSIEINEGLLAFLNLLDNIIRTSKIDELLKTILVTAKEVMRAEASSLMLLDESRETLRIIVPTGPIKEQIKGISIPANRGYTGWVIEHQEAVVANNIQQDDAIFGGDLSENFTTYNLICVPLYDESEQVIGVLEVVNRRNKEAFREEEIPILQTLANHVVQATEKIHTKKELSDTLEEHNLLLKEIHHRVKNDFALIAGIIEMERIDYNSEARAMLSKIKSRIETMSLVYDLLTSSTDSGIVVAPFFGKLTRILSQTLSISKREIKIEVEASDFALSSRPALYCGLLINELLLNAFKHAFTDAEKGKINLEILKEESLITIIYTDDGKGLPDDFKLEDQTSHGFEIIKALASQLEGTITVGRPPKGTVYTITFEVAEHKKKDTYRLFWS